MPPFPASPVLVFISRLFLVAKCKYGFKGIIKFTYVYPDTGSSITGHGPPTGSTPVFCFLSPARRVQLGARAGSSLKAFLFHIVLDHGWWEREKLEQILHGLAITRCLHQI